MGAKLARSISPTFCDCRAVFVVNIACKGYAVGLDQRAFELLVIKYQRRVERLISRMVRDVDLVEDIAQEAFINAYRALHQFRGDAQFYTWLYRIAVNTAKKFLLELKRDHAVSDSALASKDEDDETFSSQERTKHGRNPRVGAGRQGNRSGRE